MTPAPRTLFLAPRFPPDLGGVSRSAGRIASALRAHAPLDVLSWTRSLAPGALEEREHAHGRDLRLGLFKAEDLSLQHTANLIEELHDEREYGLLWGHYLSPAGFLAVWMGRLLGLPAVVGARGNDVDRMAFPPGDFARLTWTLEHAERVLCVSEDLARKVRALVGERASVGVTPNSVDGELFRPREPDPALRDALGLRPEERVLGFSGELRHKKGLAHLLDAYLEVRAARPACLLIIGEVRPRELEQLARLGAQDPEARARVLITGHLEDPAAVAAHLALVDLFLLPSLWEGMPNALLEAMAMERVVLCSDAGGIPEVVRDREEGFVVRRAELHRLGEAALELCNLSEAERARYGRAARRGVLERHSPASERARMAALLEELHSPSSA